MLYLNGWSAAFVVCFVLLLNFIPEGARGLVPLAGLASCVVAALFALAMSPFLAPWRAAMMNGRHYLPLSAFLSVGLLAWSVLSFSLVVVGFAASQYGTDPREELLAALDLFLDGLGSRVMGLAWAFGFLVCLLARQVISQHQELVYPEATTWRKLLSGLVVLPYLLLVFEATGVVLQGARLDPSIQAAYQREIRAALEGRNVSMEERVASQLPPDFLAEDSVRKWLGHRRVDRAKLVRLWCRQAARFWGEQEFWNHYQLVALARLAALESLLTDDVPPALAAELAVRSEVILVEHGGVDPTQSHRLYDLRLSSQQWARLIDLALDRNDLLRAAALTDADVRERFVDGAAQVLGSTDYDMDGKLQRKYFQRCAQRRELNRLWQAYQSGKPYPEAGPPLGLQDFKKRYAASLDFDLEAVEHDVAQATFREDLARQNLAYDIVLMELKRLEADGARLPRSWDEFRPEIASVGRAYSDWINLIPSESGVGLRRTEPRSGMALTHTFKTGQI